MRASRPILTLLLALATLAGCIRPIPRGASGPVPTDSVLVATGEPDLVQFEVYFTDRARFEAGDPPFEVAVPRLVQAGRSLPEAALIAFFMGPTEEEQARGLEAVTSGFTGFRALEIKGGVAHVYLDGPCASGGGVYTIAQPLMANLLQFDEISHVKIYDSDGVTGQPEGDSNSIPPCLEP